MKRIAVVTGAAGGMGRAIVDRLLEDGLHVVGVDLNAPTCRISHQKSAI